MNKKTKRRDKNGILLSVGDIVLHRKRHKMIYLKDDVFYLGLMNSYGCPLENVDSCDIEKCGNISSPKMDAEIIKSLFTHNIIHEEYSIRYHGFTAFKQLIIQEYLNDPFTQLKNLDAHKSLNRIMENNEDEQVLIDKRSLRYLFEKSNELTESIQNNGNSHLIGARAGSLHTEMLNIVVPLIFQKDKTSE